ncbi:MAG: hypothetical protein ACYC9J_11470 [Sulfuricaulis sp.]
MGEARRIAKMETDNLMVEGEIGNKTVEVAEAIKALQSQLADLRKIVQAAKVSGAEVTEVGRRRQ